MAQSTANDDTAIRDELKAFDENFEHIHVEDNTGPVPDGRWQGRIERASLTRATSQKPMIEWVIIVTTEGVQAGKKLVVRWVITEKTLEWIKKALIVLRLKIEKISTIADHLPQATGALVDFTIKTKEENRNVYFNRRLDDGKGERVEDDGKTTIIEDFPV